MWFTNFTKATSATISTKQNRVDIHLCKLRDTRADRFWLVSCHDAMTHLCVINTMAGLSNICRCLILAALVRRSLQQSPFPFPDVVICTTFLAGCLSSSTNCLEGLDLVLLSQSVSFVWPRFSLVWSRQTDTMHSSSMCHGMSFAQQSEYAKRRYTQIAAVVVVVVVVVVEVVCSASSVVLWG